MATNQKNAPLALPIRTLLGLPMELIQIERVNQLQPSPLGECQDILWEDKGFQSSGPGHFQQVLLSTSPSELNLSY